VADTGNNLLRRITRAGVVSTLAGQAGVTGAQNGIGSAARFKQPYGVVVDADGTVYVADTFNNLIRKVVPVQAP
jgi:DNA-binding beta-propeller fold protein YncE